MLEKLVTLITDLIAALNRNSDLLEGGASATDKPAGKTTTTKTTTETKAPPKTTTKTETKAKPPIKNKVVSVEDAVQTSTNFMAVDDKVEREKRKNWVIALVKSLGFDKVREIDNADDRSTLVLKIEQTIEAGELLPIETDESLAEEVEDEV